MKQQTILYGIIGLLVGSLVTVFITQTAVNTNNQGMMRMMGLGGMMNSIEREERYENRNEQNDQRSEVGMGTSMRGMMVSMEGKSGVEFDKSFLEAMIVHHEGAIEMAKEAKEKGQHPQVKQMAEDIISVQTKEIEQMKSWISEWGL